MSDITDTADPLAELARSRLGVRYLYPIQRFVISNTMEGRPQIVVLPTGAGKSLCFQLPALLLPGATLVLVPLLSLMSDQMRKLQNAGIAVDVLRGGLSPREKQELFIRARSGRTSIVLATPEACLTKTTLGQLRSCRFDHLVIDEAHCVSEWGDSFRPAYLDVGRIAREAGIRMRTAFTATASPRVIARIRELVFEEGEVRIVAGAPDRPNIAYRVAPVLSVEEAVLDLIRESERPLLVFFRTRGGAELAARSARVCLADRKVFFYHAGLGREERARVERWFLESKDGALMATCAYGLGVDKPNIRTVAHAQVPSSVEAYLQETGRAGRDGLASRAVLLVSREDRAFVAGLPPGSARQRYEGMLSYALSRDTCRRQALLALIGQDPVACSGCDVCDNSVPKGPQGAEEIIRFVAANRRRFTPGRIASILSGAGGPRSVRAFDDSVRGFGGLRGWLAQNVEAAIARLVTDGELVAVRRGPWKGTVTLPRRARPPRAPQEARS